VSTERTSTWKRGRGGFALSSAEAPYEEFLGDFFNIRSARGVVGSGKGREPLSSLFPLPGIPRALSFSLSPGLRLRSLYGQSNTKEASAEERGGFGYRQKRCFLKLRKDADRKRLFCSNVSTLLSMIVYPRTSSVNAFFLVL